MGELEHMRTAFGHALVELGRARPDVVALSADVSNSDFSYMFANEFPARFYNVGIAEQSLIDVAVGLSYAGKVPFANTFAFLLATRALEPIRTHCCYGRANVKIMAGYCGLSPFTEGPTHHAISDIAIMRSLPNMTVVAPADCEELRKLLPQVAEWDGAVYFRFNRNDVPAVFGSTHQPVIGRAELVGSGDDVTLIGTGLMVSRCVDAAASLAVEGISARVIDMHTLKPLDVETIVAAAEETGAIVTAEEHSIIGGLGAAVAEAVCDARPVPVKRVGLRDQFAGCGPYFELLDRHGMSVQDIVDAAHGALKLKGSAVAR
jgi:transketolase